MTNTTKENRRERRARRRYVEQGGVSHLSRYLRFLHDRGHRTVQRFVNRKLDRILKEVTL